METFFVRDKMCGPLTNTDKNTNNRGFGPKGEFQIPAVESIARFSSLRRNFSCFY